MYCFARARCAAWSTPINPGHGQPKLQSSSDSCLQPLPSIYKYYYKMILREFCNIEEKLAAGCVREIDFSSSQRAMLRRFWQDPQSSWCRYDPGLDAQRGSSTASRGQRVSSYPSLQQTSLLCPSLEVTEIPNTLRSSAPVPHHESSVVHEHNTVETTERTTHLRGESHKLAGPQVCHTDSVPAVEDSRLGNLTSSYRPFSDLSALSVFLKSMAELLDGHVMPEWLRSVNGAGRMISFYISAETAEVCSRALKKITALAFETTFGSSHISEEELDDLRRRSGYTNGYLRQQIKLLRRSGRGCARLVEAFGIGCLFLLDDPKIWGKLNEIEQNRLLLGQNQTMVHNLPRFTEQCEALKKPTADMLKRIQEEVRSCRQVDSRLASPIATPTPVDTPTVVCTTSHDNSSLHVTADHVHAISPQMAVGVTTFCSDVSAHLDLVAMSARPIQNGSSFHDPSRLSYSPSPPLTFLMPENLYRLITVYFEDCCGKMVFDDHEILLSQDGVELRNQLCTTFDSYCFTATMFNEKRLYEEFGRALSKACALVGRILQAEHPRTLACFFEVLIHLLQAGLPQVVVVLRGFIKEMSAETSRKEGIWCHLFQLLDEIDLECLVHVMTQGWRCITDVLDRKLGSSHRLAVSVRLDYVKRAMIENHSEEEGILRRLLSQMGSRPVYSTPRVMLNLAHNLNRQGRHDEAEKVALEVFSMLQHFEIYAGRVGEKVESLKVLSRSHFIHGKTFDAEWTIREAIQIIVDQWGQKHPWVLEFMNVLEGWLRGWDREEDANALRGQIKLAIDG